VAPSWTARSSSAIRADARATTSSPGGSGRKPRNADAARSSWRSAFSTRMAGRGSVVRLPNVAAVSPPPGSAAGCSPCPSTSRTTASRSSRSSPTTGSRQLRPNDETGRISRERARPSGSSATSPPARMSSWERSSSTIAAGRGRSSVGRAATMARSRSRATRTSPRISGPGSTKRRETSRSRGRPSPLRSGCGPGFGSSARGSSPSSSTAASATVSCATRASALCVSTGGSRTRDPTSTWTFRRIRPVAEPSARAWWCCTAFRFRWNSSPIARFSVRSALELEKPRRSTAVPKFVFVTGGVTSSLGKGITAASLGRILAARGLAVASLKMDPYLNVDPGTMSPYQHGEVFVTEDGAAPDLDLGHYERYIDRNVTQASNLTTGQIYNSVIAKERRGDYLGATVQVIPHVTNEIKERIHRVAREQQAEIVVVEVGGTVGDIESLPYLEAIRQFRKDVGKQNVLYIHLTLLPRVATGELKTKPTQHSVRELRAIGI